MPVLSNKTGRYLLFAAAVFAAIYFLFLVREVVITFFIGAILAYILFRPVQYIEKKGLSRVGAIALLYLTVFIILTVFLWLAIPRVAADLGNIALMLPKYTDQVQGVAAKAEKMDLPAQVHELIKENTAKIERYIYSSLKVFISVFYKFLSKIFIVIFAPILAFYMLKDWERIRDSFLKLLAPQTRRSFQIVGNEIDIALVNFLKGHLFVSFLVGVSTGLAAFIFGVKFALLIGIISGISNLVPYFGPFLGGIPAVALALSESSRLAIYMALAILIIQQVESNFITPRIIGDRLGLHPLVIVFALLAGGKLSGIWGMLLAVPIIAVFKVIVNFIFYKMVEQ